MRVGINCEQLNIDGQCELITDFKIFFSRRNIERGVVLKLQQHGQFARRRRSEVETDTGLDHFRFPGRLQMRVKNKVRAFVETQRHALRLNVGYCSWLPEKQVAIRVEDLGFDSDLHPAKSSARSGFPAAQRSSPVDQNIRMVYVTLIAGADFDCFYPARLLNR